MFLYVCATREAMKDILSSCSLDYMYVEEILIYQILAMSML